MAAAAALLILGSQLGALTGLRAADWGALLSTPSLGLFDLTAAGFGLGSLALLMLASSKGKTLQVCADGEDAEHALRAVADLIKNGFDEN